MTRLSQVLRLERRHDRSSFSSGAPELDRYLAEFAWQNQRANNATTFVVLDEEGGGARIVAYYSITVAGLGREAVPSPVSKGSPTQMGALLLARFAITEELQGRGLGRALLADVLSRTVQLSEAVAVKMLLIHCRDEAAKAFYMRQAEFLESPTDPMHLILEVKEIKKLIA